MSVQPGVYRFRNAKSGTYLDESNNNPDTVHGWDSRPQNANQKWIVEPAGNGFHLRNAGHSLYISASGPYDNAEVKATGNQSTWTFNQQGGGYAIYLEGSGHVIDLDYGKRENGTRVSLWGYTGAQQQLWVLEPVQGDYSGGQQQQQYGGYQQQQQYGGYQQQPQQPQQQVYQGPIQPGTYRVRNVFTQTALDLAGGKPDEGTPVIGWSVGTGINQTWVFEAGSQGYRIKNGASGTYLGFDNLTEGVLLSGRSQATEWTVTQSDQGYQIHPAQNSGWVVDLADGKKDDGAKICLWSNKDGPNQKWNLAQA